MRVFISSTCYDLIDLRAEIADFFRQAGVEPVLSDDPISDFHSKTDANSIEACLANVRSCEAFIIILSNRYGPKVNIQPYDGKSATHLEYDEAVRTGKPIWMYVRDKTEGEFALWKRNKTSPDFTSVWVPRPEWSLFELLSEHRSLTESRQKQNWFSIFRDSVELKQILKKDFSGRIADALVEKLTESGRIPYLEVTGRFNSSTHNSITIDLRFRNHGETPALHTQFEILTQPDVNAFPLESVSSNQEILKKITWAFISGSNLQLQTRLRYSILQGHTFEDVGELVIRYSSHTARVRNEVPSISYILHKRIYVGLAPHLLPSISGI